LQQALEANYAHCANTRYQLHGQGPQDLGYEQASQGSKYVNTLQQHDGQAQARVVHGKAHTHGSL
jgi:hypothetical protein